MKTSKEYRIRYDKSFDDLLKKLGITKLELWKRMRDYKEHDRVIPINDNDIDLKTFYIPMPFIPELNDIEGFGLLNDEQYFRYEEMPDKLVKLEKSRDTIQEIWDELQKNQLKYIDEINWIKKQWHYRLHGKWFFNNGKPTYITGANWFFLNYWIGDEGINGKPIYIDAQSWLFHVMKFVQTNTVDYNGHNWHRLLYCGFTLPKMRQTGATTIVQCENFEYISRTKNALAGIQSMTERHAKKVHQNNLVRPFLHLPFFFKPKYYFSNGLIFGVPQERATKEGNKAHLDLGLQSEMNYRNSLRGEYDGEGERMKRYHRDEAGKTLEENVKEAHFVVKEAMSPQLKVRGMMAYTSTVGEMESKGGEAFYELCEMSHINHVNKNGVTDSGLINVFFPAYYNYRGCIDKYGNSDIVKAKKIIENTINSLREKERWEELAEFKRLYPMRYRDCFNTNTMNVGFNLTKIDEAITRIRFSENQPTIQGNIEWENNIQDGNLIFVPHKRGRFIISEMPDKNMIGAKIWSSTDNTWYLQYPGKYSAGADPFKFNESPGKKSLGGGTVFKLYDENADGIKPVELYTSNHFVCTYLYKPYDKDEYTEDMLKMSLFFQALMYPEANLPYIQDWFIKRKYKGILNYGIDDYGRLNMNAGGHSLAASKEEIFSEMMTYIERHSVHENHIELLQDCYNIKGVKDMKNYDRFTAAGYALLGAKMLYKKQIMMEGDDLEIKDELFETFNY